jgi:hypothetical protein
LAAVAADEAGEAGRAADVPAAFPSDLVAVAAAELGEAVRKPDRYFSVGFAAVAAAGVACVGLERGKGAPRDWGFATKAFAVGDAGPGGPSGGGTTAASRSTGGAAGWGAGADGSESCGTPSAVLIGMRWPHWRHFILTERPATRSSAIWYFALQFGQMNFIQRSELAI